MDPLFIAAAGSAVLAVVLKGRRPVEQVPDETFCPPVPPPIESEAWVEIAKQATGLVGAGGAAAAGILIPGVGVAIGGAIALGQQVASFGLDTYAQATTGKKEQIRQKLIDTCYGNPPGTIFTRYGTRKSLGVTYTLLDLYFVTSKGVLDNGLPGISVDKLNAEHPVTIPNAADVKYFVTTGPNCCAKRISPAQAVANGHKLYTEAGARAFWLEVATRRRMRELARQLTLARSMEAQASTPQGAQGTGRLKGIIISNSPISGYKVQSRQFSVCHPTHGLMDLWCHPTDPNECMWVVSGVACTAQERRDRPWSG